VCNDQAEQSLAGDGLQRPLRSRFQPRLKRGVRLHHRKEITVQVKTVRLVVMVVLGIVMVLKIDTM